jgi:hypothetical protein
MCFTNDLSGKIVTTMGSHAKNQKQKKEKGKKKKHQKHTITCSLNCTSFSSS